MDTNKRKIEKVKDQKEKRKKIGLQPEQPNNTNKPTIQPTITTDKPKKNPKPSATSNKQSSKHPTSQTIIQQTKKPTNPINQPTNLTNQSNNPTNQSNNLTTQPSNLISQTTDQPSNQPNAQPDKQPTNLPPTIMKRLSSSLQAHTANVSGPLTNSSTNTASTAITTPMVVNQPIGVAPTSDNSNRIQIKDEATKQKITNLAANEKHRLKKHGLIRISLHGTSAYTEPELRHILTRLHTKNAEHVGNNLIVATVKVGNLSTIDKSDKGTISELDEFGPVLDQSTQVSGIDIDDMITTCNMSQWQEQVETPALIENPNFVTSTAKPKEVNFNQRAFFNYTKYPIPEDVGVILSMGPKFAVPVYYRNEDFDKLKEAALMINEAYCHIDDQKTIRTQIIEHLRDYQAAQYIEHSSEIRDYFNEALKHTKRFLKTHPDIVVTQADKARATILMDRPTYINKVENLLKDCSTYAPLKSSSIAAYMKINEGLLVKLEKTNWVTREKIERAIENENHVANLYALIKTHKKDAPPRPIVNTRNTPGYLAATIVTQILTKVRDIKKYNVLNSRMACEKLQNTTIAPDEKFYSFDIVSMFTNIPVDRTIEAIKKRQSRLDLDDEQLNLIIDVVKFVCLTSTEIMFNNKTYKQIRGLRMGSALSPILADFVVEDMLDSAFRKIDRPVLLIKYVDDIMAVIEEEKAEEMLTALNQMDPHIKFEIEKELDHRINYLDVTIINEGWQPKTKWYQKHISSGTFLNYHSHHSKSNIWNTAVQYVVTMICNTHPDFFEEILETAMERLNRNSYPVHYAKKVIIAAQEKIVQKMGATQGTSSTQSTNLNTEEGSFYCESLNYIPKLTEKLKKILEENAAKAEQNIQIPLKPTYKMGQQIYNKQKNSNQNQGQKPNNHPASVNITMDDTNIDLTQH